MGFMISLAVIYQFMALVIVFSVVKKQLSKAYYIVVVYIELCVIAAIYFDKIAMYGLIGIIGIGPLVSLLKKRLKGREKQ